MRIKFIFAFIYGIIISFLLLHLNSIAPTVTAQSKTTLLISAAASLQNALKEIEPIFEQSKKKIEVNYNFGSSGALQRQIEQGAPVDIFFSAATKQMNTLQDKNLIIATTRHNLLNNKLVLIVPINSSLNIKNFHHLTINKVKRIAVGEFRTVPAGQYSEELLKKLGILERIKPKLVFSNNVRAVLSAVESGNVDAGIVYATDAKISNKVRVLAIADQSLHSPIVYPIAVLENSKKLEAAKEFIQFLSIKQARIIFENYGFKMIR